MNSHIQEAFEGIISPESLQTLFISPFTIRNFGSTIASQFRETFIAIFAADMRIAMYVSVAALGHLSVLGRRIRQPLIRKWSN
jgi:hypothetical protein